LADSVLEKLRLLQDADLEVRRMEQSKAAHDRALRVRSEQIAKHKQTIEALKVRHRQARMAVDKKELEVRQKRGEIEKLRQQQTLVRDNRQFAALQNEMRFAELSISKYEDEILTDMGDMEAIDADTKKAHDELAKLEKDLDAARKDTDAKKGGIDAEITEKRRRRDEIAAGLPPRIVDLFSRIADRLDGEALAPVVRDDEDPDEGIYICGGCHMGVTQNTYVLLAGRNENLCTCPNCTRILYLEKS
jgi:predicted  nucleic acid-binding Zn-ribbon protein